MMREALTALFPSCWSHQRAVASEQGKLLILTEFDTLLVVKMSPPS